MVAGEVRTAREAVSVAGVAEATLCRFRRSIAGKSLIAHSSYSEIVPWTCWSVGIFQCRQLDGECQKRECAHAGKRMGCRLCRDCTRPEIRSYPLRQGRRRWADDSVAGECCGQCGGAKQPRTKAEIALFFDFERHALVNSGHLMRAGAKIRVTEEVVAHLALRWVAE